MVGRTVVARETCRILRSCRKSTRFPHMARRALLLQNGMSFAQPAAGVHAIVMREKVPANPHQRHRRRKNRQQEFGSLERSRPLEIVQVDPLRYRLGRACSCHTLNRVQFSVPGIAPAFATHRHSERRNSNCPTVNRPFTIASPSLHEPLPAKSAPAKAGCAVTASHAASDAFALAVTIAAPRCKYLPDR